MMLLSVFTPSHNTRYLDDCYRSLAAQTHTDWEWIVALNGSAGDWTPAVVDDRVRVMRAHVPPLIGAAKRVACELCTGEILVELDHDDQLLPGCLAAVADGCAAHPDAPLVFTDFAQMNRDGTRNDTRFNLDMGWEYDDQDGWLRCRSMAPYPHNVGLIWFAPNHVRAFPRAAYEQVGGHDPRLAVLDDQDLMTRLFLAGDFHHIGECLYLQRVHGDNTQAEADTNAFIQAQTVRYYEKRIADLASAWSERRGLDVLKAADARAVPDNSAGLIDATGYTGDLVSCWPVLVHGGVLITEGEAGYGGFMIGHRNDHFAALVAVKQGPRMGGLLS